MINDRKWSEDEIRQFSELFIKIEKEVKKMIIGQADVIRNVLIAIISGGNVLLEGLPGLGKTQMVKAVASAAELSFSRIQFTPDLMPSDVTGTDIFIKSGEGGSFEFSKGPIFANLVLADEINRATPKTQSALLEAMQEQTVTAGQTTYTLPAPFFVLATQNPLEMEGTYPLPEAQMDRFMFKLQVGFPNEKELLEILNLTTGNGFDKPEKAADGETLLRMRSLARSVAVSSAVAGYVSSVVVNTHPDTPGASEIVKKYLRYGASPRGAQALILGAKVLALLDGRYNISYSDVDKLAGPALRHRIFLNYEALSDGIAQDEIIAAVLAEQKNGV